MLTTLAVVLVGIWLVLQSQSPQKATVTLIFGVAVAVLAVLDLVWTSRPYWNRPAP